MSVFGYAEVLKKSEIENKKKELLSCEIPLDNIKINKAKDVIHIAFSPDFISPNLKRYDTLYLIRLADIAGKISYQLFFLDCLNTFDIILRVKEIPSTLVDHGSVEKNLEASKHHITIMIETIQSLLLDETSTLKKPLTPNNKELGRPNLFNKDKYILFKRAYYQVLAKKRTSKEVREEFGISESTYWRYAKRVREEDPLYVKKAKSFRENNRLKKRKESNDTDCQ